GSIGAEEREQLPSQCTFYVNLPGRRSEFKTQVPDGLGRTRMEESHDVENGCRAGCSYRGGSSPCGAETERAYELEKTDVLIPAAAKGRQAVIGASTTLDALNDKRVRELVYAQGDAIGADFIEDAVGLALAQRAAIEQVRGEAAARLKTAGGIGAFLRY